MDRRALIALASLGALAVSSRASADRLHWDTEIRVRNGASKAPFAVPEQSRVTSEFTAARLTVLQARWRVVPDWELGLTLPAAASLVKRPAGSYLEDNAFGTLALRADRLLISRRFSVLAVGLGVGIPLPWHGPAGSRTRNRVLASASAIDLWRDGELYHPGTVPLVPQLRYSRRRDRVVLAGTVKLPVLLRVHDAHLPPGRTRSVGFLPGVRGLASGHWIDWLAPYLAAQVSAVAPAPDRQPAAVSLGGEMGLLVSLTDSLELRALALSSMVGALDGTWGFGLDLRYARHR